MDIFGVRLVVMTIFSSTEFIREGNLILVLESSLRIFVFSILS